jgi:hypothetical protein
VRVQKRKVCAPEMGRVWLNSAALRFRQLREAAGGGRPSLRLKYEASAGDLVRAAPRGTRGQLRLLPGGEPVARSPATKEVRFHASRESCVVVDCARMYALVSNHEFGKHERKPRGSPGVAGFAFTFAACVDRVAGAGHAPGSAEL